MLFRSHVKNISLLMNRSGEWRLSPAYDVTYSYDVTNKWLSAHQMTINGKKSNINLTDLLAAGENMGLKKKKCKDIISQISLVVADFEKYAEESNIREKTFCDIKKILDQNKVEV